MPSFKSLDENLSTANSQPCCILIGSDSSQVEPLEKTIESVNEVSPDTSYLSSHSSQIKSSITRIIGVSKDPLLCILDLKGGKNFVFDKEPTAENCREWLKSYHEGTLKPHRKTGSRPENDDHPTHAGLKVVVADSFEELVLESDKHFFVDLYADWCGPCRAVAPILAQAAFILKKIGAQDIQIGKLDVDANDVDKKYFPENGIPNMKLFVKGEKENPLKFQEERSVESLLGFLHKHCNECFDLDEAKKIIPEAKLEYEKQKNKKVHVLKDSEDFSKLQEEAGNKLVVVDYTASWCGPCQYIAPLFADMSEEFNDCVFIKVDVDEFADISGEAGVSCMPTFHLMRKGDIVEKLEGANVDSLRKLIDRKSVV